MKRIALVVTAVAVSVAITGRAAAQEAPSSDAAATSSTQPSGRGLFDESPGLRKGLQFGDKYFGQDDSEDPKKNGFYPELGNMVTGAGWISAGVGYRHWLNDRVLVDGSTGLSWRAYKMAQVRLEVQPFAGDRFAVGTQVRWQDLTQINYFGEGPETVVGDRSHYRLRSVNTVGYAVVRPREWLAVHADIGWLSAPALRAPAGTFQRDLPSTLETLDGDPVVQRLQQPDYVHGQLSVVADTRDEPGYPRSGGIYRAAWANYAARGNAPFDFGRYEAEAAQFVPLNGHLVLALRGWLVGTSTDTGQHVPFYLLPSMGGNNTIRGYHDYRFHGRNTAAINTELRLAMTEHIDAVALFDAGNVAARFRDLDLDKRSYGVGVRVHSATSTYARLEFAKSDEGWQVVFRLNDPLSLSRIGRRTAQVPYAP